MTDEVHEYFTPCVQQMMAKKHWFKQRIKLLKKCLSCVYRLICFVGLLVQVATVTKTYLEYPTSTKLTIDVDHYLKIPDFTICMSVVSILDSKWVRQAKRLDVKRDSDNVSQVLSVQEILDETPSSHHIMDSCMTRSSNSYQVFFHQGTRCLNVFNITKSVFGEYVCYTLELKTNSTIDLRKITFSRRLSRVLFIFNLNDSLSSVMTLKPMVHMPGSFPYKTASFSMTHNRKPYGQPDLLPNFNTIKSSYTKYVISRLPPPFGSKCRNYSATSDVDYPMTKEDCIQKCLLRSVPQELGKVPFTSAIRVPVKLIQLSMLDMDDDATSAILNRLELDCRSQCSQLDCHSTFTITSGFTEVDVKMRLLVYSPNSPDLLLQEEEAFRFLDFLIFVSSCVGSWLGLSFISFDPVDLYEIMTSWSKSVSNQVEPKRTGLVRRRSIFTDKRTCLNFNVTRELESYKEYNRRLLSSLETTRKKEMSLLRQELQAFKKQLHLQI